MQIFFLLVVVSRKLFWRKLNFRVQETETLYVFIKLQQTIYIPSQIEEGNEIIGDFRIMESLSGL